jgi:Mg-chelatase subunit ChlD
MKFLDSLKSGDRVAVMGWTAVGTPAGLADTATITTYFQKWAPFSSDFQSARSFIRDSLFIDSTRRIVSTCNGQTLVIRDNIPNGQFTSTPMRISSVVAAKHLSALGRHEATKAVIMLTDGENNDGLARSVAVNFLDSLKKNNYQQFHAIGFISGDTSELRALTSAGGGSYYNAANPRQLDSVYAALAQLLIARKTDTTFTTTKIMVSPDTLRMPVDVLLSIDLSGSMSSYDGTSRQRIAWAKIAALGFLDSLKQQDRVAVLGWTGTGAPLLTDTINASRYFAKWCPFTFDMNQVRSFIRDSIFLESATPLTDTFNGKTMTLWNDIPNGSFTNTPLHMSSVLSMSHLSGWGRPNANRVAIMLTDGINNDGISQETAVAILDSIRRTQGVQMHTIGFVSGDTAELHTLAFACGGNFYNAQDNIALLNAYSSLAHLLTMEKLAARKLMIQEVIKTPPLYFMTGTQKATSNSTVQMENCESVKDSKGNTVLRWYFKNIPVWGIAEVSYKVIASLGAGTMIGLDSIHAGGGFYSQMIYTDDAYQVVTINLAPTGNSGTVGIVNQAVKTAPMQITQRSQGMVVVTMHNMSQVTLTVFSIQGVLVYKAVQQPTGYYQPAIFILPKTVAPGFYAARVEATGTTVQRAIRIIH